MNLLHIHSDWKWTGPSEPILNLCSGLKQKGHNIFLACLETPPGNKGDFLPERARVKGIEPLFLRRPRKLTAFFALIENIKRIEHFLNACSIDIIHTHSTLDHFIAAKAVRHFAAVPKIIRTNHKGIPLLPSLITNWLIKKHTDGYIALSEGLLRADRKTFNILNDAEGEAIEQPKRVTPSERSWVVEGAINLDRFNPKKTTKNLRPELGINPNDLVIGVVARIQRHRRFEIIIRALKKLTEKYPYIKLLVVGRGTHQNEVLIEPARQMGLEHYVIHTGYRKDDYVETLATMDFGLFLVPGSDGSCRAVREMMAMAKPVIVAKRGVLPEIIEDKVTGLAIEDTAENLIDAISQLNQNRSLIIKYGNNACVKASNSFSLEQQTKLIERIYQAIQRQDRNQ